MDERPGLDNLPADLDMPKGIWVIEQFCTANEQQYREHDREDQQLGTGLLLLHAGTRRFPGRRRRARFGWRDLPSPKKKQEFGDSRPNVKS